MGQKSSREKSTDVDTIAFNRVGTYLALSDSLVDANQKIIVADLMFFYIADNLGSFSHHTNFMSVIKLKLMELNDEHGWDNAKNHYMSIFHEEMPS